MTTSELCWIEASEDERAQSQRLNDLVEQVLGSVPSVHTVDPAETRRQRREGGGLLPPPVRLDHAEDLAVDGPAGPVPLRVLRPRTTPAVGAYLHLHGGGWVLGAHDEQDERLVALAEATGLVVVSVGYRLAPEHPFPAAPDDCEAAARWLLEGGAEALGLTGPAAQELTIGGESAGAHLAVLTLLRLRDDGVTTPGGASPFRAANLVYGCFDLSGTPSQLRWGDRNLVLSGPIIEWFLDCFLPGTTVVERRRPDISPLHAELGGLPPALVTVGDVDPLLDDSLFLATRWRSAGNDVRLEVYPESMHGFTGMPTDLATRSEASQAAFLREHVAPSR